MKKLYYESPTVEVVDVRVEGGFGVSDFGTNNASSYDVVNENDADEVDSY